MNSEREIRNAVKKLANQRVGMILQPGNVLVIERAVDDDEKTDTALETAYMRGWIEPINRAIRKGRLTTDGQLPPGDIFSGTGTLWRVTEGGWAVINRTHLWTQFAILLSIFSLVVALGSLVVSLKGMSGR